MQPTLFVPYVVEEPNRDKLFSPEMEKAAILCLAEVNKRSTGLLRKNPEEVGFILKLHYPLWCIPWGEKYIIVDSLGLSETSINQINIPNIIDFTEDLKRSSISFSLFQKTLGKHTNTFNEFDLSKKEILKAIVGEDSTLKSLSDLFKHPKTIIDTKNDIIFLTPQKYNSSKATTKAENLVSIWETLCKESNALKFALKTLEEEKNHHNEKASIEIEQIWEEYEERIFEMKRLGDKILKKQKKEKENEINKTKKLYEKQLKKLISEDRRLQTKLEKEKFYLKENRRRRKIQKKKYPKRSLIIIDNKIRAYQKIIRDTNSARADIERIKEEIFKEKEELQKKIEKTFLKIVSREMNNLEILNQSRNLDISKKHKEIKKIEENSNAILDQIKILINQITTNMNSIIEKAITFNITKFKKEILLLGIPFYLVQYKTPQETRIDINPPVSVTNFEGINKRVRLNIFTSKLKSRIRFLLKPRSIEINRTLFMNLKKSLTKNMILRNAVSEVGRDLNLLRNHNFQEDALIGIRYLEEESWLTAKEKEHISNTFNL
jgi:hypothetical protein